MSTESFGHRLRRERDRLGLTQDDFGRLGGVKRLTQYLYEQDSRVPDLRYLMRLAEAGVDVVYLLLGRAERLADPECIAISPAQLSATIDKPIDVGL
jgi:transcriptional regulator with XRE-family HTH domain